MKIALIYITSVKATLSTTPDNEKTGATFNCVIKVQEEDHELIYDDVDIFIPKITMKEANAQKLDIQYCKMIIKYIKKNLIKCKQYKLYNIKDELILEQ